MLQEMTAGPAHVSLFVQCMLPQNTCLQIETGVCAFFAITLHMKQALLQAQD